MVDWVLFGIQILALVGVLVARRRVVPAPHDGWVVAFVSLMCVCALASFTSVLV